MKIQIQFLLMILISLLVQAQAQEITERSIKEILNSDGTIRKGVEGSFNVQGYQMHYGKNGDPIFLPKPQDITEGTWSPLGTGSNNGTSGYTTPYVYALAVSGENIFVGGMFTQAGGQSANYVARFNLATNTWHSLGTGTSNGVSGLTSPYVVALAVSGDNVFVGGYFTQAGGQSANRVARFNLTTNTWHSLGTGTNNGVGGVNFPSVSALAVSGENLFVGGFFNQAGGQSVNNIARYNIVTDTWHSLGTGTSNGVSSSVNAIAISGDNIFVGGGFQQAGGQFAGYIARYNLTTGTWHSLGTYPYIGADGGVFALAASGENLFVGGNFTFAGGQSAKRVARYNITTNTWHSLGIGSNNGVNSNVNALAVSDDNVIVGGNFTFSFSGGVTTYYVASYNLTTNTWSSIGSGTANGVNERVQAIAVSPGNIFVGGWFTQAGGIPAKYVARYSESPSSVDGGNKSIPASVILMQNYPNPFNPSTTISFSIPESEFVTLKVYDVLGNELAILVNEYKPAGTYNVQFSTVNNQLSSGMYFYKLQAGQFSEVKKMILAK